MKVAVLSHAPPGTGTYTSSHRIARHLQACEHAVDVVEYWDADIEGARHQYDFRSADLLVGTHAVQSGSVFAGLGVPYILILSGTDLNEHIESPIADDAARNAQWLVAYDEQHLEKALRRWPTCREKLRHIPKGVQTFPSQFDVRDRLGLSASTRLFLLPSGLRPVKDVLYLADIFDRRNDDDLDDMLAIVGLPRDPAYVQIVHRRCERSRTIRLLPPLRQQDLHAAMRQADFVLNTSRSESSANAVLEAMHLGACVVAKDIPGNRALIEHDATGLLFRTPAEFAELMEGVVDDELPTRLGTAAASYVRAHHGLEQEQRRYCQLLSECV